MSTLFFLFGHLLEVLSTSADEAYTAFKLLYAGAAFLACFSFFFVADYCEVKLPLLRVKLPLLLPPLLSALLAWTTKYHHLIYQSYWFDDNDIHYLNFEPGAFYNYIHYFPLLYMSASIIIILCRMNIWPKQYRSQLRVLLASISIPFLAEGFYFLTILIPLPKVRVYFLPHSLALMAICFYVGITRYDMFDIMSKATAMALNSIAEAFVVTDTAMNYLTSNPAARKLFPDLAQLSKAAPISDAGSWPQELTRLSAGTENQNIQFCLSGQEIKYYTAGVNPILSRQSQHIGWIILIQDITDSVTLMRQLQNAAYTDALTGLHNRRYFMDMATMYFEKSKRSGSLCYAMMLDLDYFKNINDIHGHLAGDYVLKTLSNHIKDIIRSYDLLARYGGEEFVVLLTDSAEDTALSLAERIRNSIAHSPCHYKGADISVTVSIGIAGSMGTPSLTELLNNADDALYTAKSQGRNRVVMHPAPAQTPG
jgi:diguanylate cyclase (GGDEF)-like protein